MKAPFETSGGNVEYMWVDVQKWTEETITGLLRSEPRDVSGLHAGQEVEVDPETVFDYLRRFPDGTEEGNETGELIRKLHEERGE